VTGKKNTSNILDAATTTKANKYRELAAREDSSFTALAVLSYGKFSPEFTKFIKKMANAFVEATPLGVSARTPKDQNKQITNEIKVTPGSEFVVSMNPWLKDAPDAEPDPTANSQLPASS
jgi:hypothetical protein